VVVVGSGAVVGVDDGRVVLVVWPEPRGDGDPGEVVPVVGSGPVVVVVVVEEVEEEDEEVESDEVGVPEPVSAGAVVVVVADGSVVVVVVESGGSVVEVVSVPAPGSAAEVSARAGTAGTQTTATNTVVTARARRMRLDNTGISSPGLPGGPPECDSGSNSDAVEHIGRQRPFVTKVNVPER
jgi:hypothetical protein